MRPELQVKMPVAAQPRGLHDTPTSARTDLAGRRDELPRPAEMAT